MVSYGRRYFQTDKLKWNYLYFPSSSVYIYHTVVKVVLDYTLVLQLKVLFSLILMIFNIKHRRISITGTRPPSEVGWSRSCYLFFAKGLSFDNAVLWMEHNDNIWAKYDHALLAMDLAAIRFMTFLWLKQFDSKGANYDNDLLGTIFFTNLPAGFTF